MGGSDVGERQVEALQVGGGAAVAHQVQLLQLVVHLAHVPQVLPQLVPLLPARNTLTCTRISLPI